MNGIGTVKCLVLLVALAVVTGDGWGQTSKMKPDAAPATPGGSVASSGVGSPAAAAAYIIGPDDVLAVNVWKEPELSRSVIVRPDGKITLPLLKDIEAGGSTTVKVVPSRSGDRTTIVPPCACTISLVMNSPSPRCLPPRSPLVALRR